MHTLMREIWPFHSLFALKNERECEPKKKKGKNKQKRWAYGI